MRKIPKYDDYELIGRVRLDATLALANSDPLLIARNLVQGAAAITKFGRNAVIANGATADIWEDGNTGGTLIWVAPTEARIHTLASTDGGDTAGGPGARTIQIWGLLDWDTAEVSEVVTMDSGSPNTAVTANAYVIIHRMKVLTKGATSSNIGEITATAAVDGTVTAQITATKGQTQMVVYGVPSTCTLYIGRLYGNVNKSAGQTGGLDVSLLQNPEPQDELLNFNTRHTFGLITTGTSALTFNYYVP